jgi:N-dimethylarginine dimethylaminohydrolase
MDLKNKFQRTEYSKLVSVLLYRPNPSMKSEKPSNVDHINKIDYKLMLKEYYKIKKAYKKNKVKVISLNHKKVDKISSQNIIFMHDLFFMTPNGAIISNMCNEIRKKEPEYINMLFKKLKIPILKKIKTPAKFEASDALWLKKDIVVIGVGNRTNEKGFQEVKKVLKKQKIKCLKVKLIKRVTPQHLLGYLQFVDEDWALVRTGIITEDIINLLSSYHINIIDVPENIEVREKQAMNIVTISPRKILMASNCPITKKLYKKNKIKVLAELKISQLINGAGGLACSTGIIRREK